MNPSTGRAEPCPPNLAYPFFPSCTRSLPGRQVLLGFASGTGTFCAIASPGGGARGKGARTPDTMDVATVTSTLGAILIFCFDVVERLILVTWLREEGSLDLYWQRFVSVFSFHYV